MRHDDAVELRTMSVQRVVNAHSPPYLIDSRLDLYRLEQLQSVHGGLWLMVDEAHGVGVHGPGLVATLGLALGPGVFAQDDIAVASSSSNSSGRISGIPVVLFS